MVEPKVIFHRFLDASFWFSCDACNFVFFLEMMVFAATCHMPRSLQAAWPCPELPWPPWVWPNLFHQPKMMSLTANNKLWKKN